MTARSPTVADPLIRAFGDVAMAIDDALVVAREGGDSKEVQALLRRRVQVEQAWATFIRAASLPARQGELL